MLEKIFIGAFGKIMIGMCLMLMTTTGWLCFQNKVNQQKLLTAAEQLELLDTDNRRLANQLENANLQIQQYQEQVKALHQNVLKKIQQSEEKTNELISTLQHVKNWSSQPVPDSIRRLLNQPTATGHGSQPNAAALPDGSTVSNANPDRQHARRSGHGVAQNPHGVGTLPAQRASPNAVH